MTKVEALRMCCAIKMLFSFSDGRYDVAIHNRHESYDNDEWAVHVFIREKGLSGKLNCALLCNAIEQISCNLLSTDSMYDISTSTEPNFVPSFIIW